MVGQRIGVYEIVAKLGEGGMGVVYRARDPRLDRTVAIKVLPDAVAHDAERLARFDREAKTLAALNHSNIAQLYGLEGSALVMEFVDGEDLSARIARGPLLVEDALAIASQVADALEAAHELGIIHRDLKSSNIRVRADGTVKVLDFGLAKALASPASVFEAQSSPTITSPAMTQAGMILGTAAYMSPEQARGKPTDKRADIWAFGVVVYEMVTGRRPFDGDTVSESLAGVMKSEPEWSRVPAELRRLVKSCLEKDPRKRLRDIGDWKNQLDDAGTRPALAAKRPWLLFATIAALAVAAISLAVVHVREVPPVAEPISFQIPAPPDHVFEPVLALSPDGRRIAFSARDSAGAVRLWVRDVASLESRLIAGAEGARSAGWSADGHSLFIVTGVTLKRIQIDSAATLTITQVEDPNSLGAPSLNRDGVVLFGGVRSGAIRRVSQSGGPVEPVTVVDVSRGEIGHGLPMFLPDGRHFLYTRVAADEASSGVFVGSLDVKPESQATSRLLAAGQAIHVRSHRGDDYLLFLRTGTLMVQTFDTGSLMLTGTPEPLVQGVGNTGSRAFVAAGGGVIAYRGGARTAGVRMAQLTWFDRQGTRAGTAGKPEPIDALALSPDGKRAVIVLAGIADVGIGNTDLWTVDLDRGVPQRLTSDAATDMGPVWSAGGDRIVFQSARQSSASLYSTPSNGTGPDSIILESQSRLVPTSVSHDGRFLLYVGQGRTTNWDVWLLPLQSDRKPVPLVQSTFAEYDGQFSPDLKWIAYVSHLSGRQEVYVRPFNAAAPDAQAGAAQVVSTEGGARPRWRHDSRELAYQAPGGTFVSVELTVERDQLRPGTPKKLFTLPPLVHWDMTADARRFLVAMPTVEPEQVPISVLLNWDVKRAR